MTKLRDAVLDFGETTGLSPLRIQSVQKVARQSNKFGGLAYGIVEFLIQLWAFWERNGYHMYGDPFLEQRHWGD